ncbi:hypothetical protein DL771_000438 [Monosporascus sp. 5C6A]|nr:hypothetical protein DL771_000438 [Monosporascus sp. 5C6A]
MSGFEIVGVILGSFPIIYEVGKETKGFYRNAKTWWRFEREFEDFIAAIDREYINFSQNLEILLTPLDIPGEDREALQNGLDSRLWNQSRIRAELRHRIQDRYYEWFMRQLTEINDALGELHGLLPVGKAYHLDSSSLESEIYRLRHSFFPRKTELLGKISDKNESIYKFLDRASLLGSLSVPAAVGCGNMRTFLYLQEQAQFLYEAFQSQWACSCVGGHPYGVTVERVSGKGRQGQDDTSLKLLFTDTRTQIKVEMEAAVAEEITPESRPRSQREDITVLRQQISLKSQLKKVKEKDSKGIFSLVLSSISALGNTSDSKTQLISAGIERPQKKLLKHSRFQRSRESDSNSSVTTSTMTSTSTVEGQSAPSISRPSQVRFVSQPQPIRARLSNSVPVITNMCQTLTEPLCGQKWLGYLEVDQRPRVLLHLDPHEQVELRSYKMESFEAFLESTPRRDARLRIGLTMVLNILSLGKANHARNSLFTIGVLLLELLFRDTLERQSFRAEYLHSGQINEYTDLCAALRWQKRAEEEFGDVLADAIRKCIVCAFDPEPDLGSGPFLKAVWLNVVRPIEDFLSAWSGS